MPRKTRARARLSEIFDLTDDSALQVDHAYPDDDAFRLVTASTDRVTRFSHGIQVEGGSGSVSLAVEGGGVVIETWLFGDGRRETVCVRSAPIPIRSIRRLLASRPLHEELDRRALESDELLDSY